MQLASTPAAKSPNTVGWNVPWGVPLILTDRELAGGTLIFPAPFGCCDTIAPEGQGRISTCTLADWRAPAWTRLDTHTVSVCCPGGSEQASISIENPDLLN